jgi:hypothetical protein
MRLLENSMKYPFPLPGSALVLGTCLLGGLAPAASAQEPVPAAATKPDPEVKKKLDELGKLAGDRKAAKDKEAIQIIDELSKGYATMHPKDQHSFAKEAAKILTSPRYKRLPEQDLIYRALVNTLGRAGEYGAPVLEKAFDAKKFDEKEWLTLRGEMLELIGRTKHDKSIDFLLDVALKNIHDSLMARAGGALRHFEEAKLEVRREIAVKLIKKFATIRDNANANLDPNDLTVKTWKDRLAAVSDPWNTTLQKLTKQHIRDPSEWNTFWNKHKDHDWDKPLPSSR